MGFFESDDLSKVEFYTDKLNKDKIKEFINNNMETLGKGDL